MRTDSGTSILQASATASGLVNRQQLVYCLRVARHRLTQQGLPANSSIPDRLLADILVEQEVVTAYQVDQLLTGRTKFNLGSYIITDWIGQGGMGQVFKAVHHVMGRVCAVKVLPLTRATLEARRHFVQEIRMQAVLDCPYLVRAYDAGQDGNVHYLVTEYVPGMDLRRLVRSQGALTLSQAARIVMQAALGLEYAHSQGLVHRDVKPGNILVTPDGEAKVSDVGLAGFAKDLINDPRAGKIIGTPDYLSPEQIRTPLEIQPASDIYSLGCTLYYALCGKVPFPGGDTRSKLRRHLDENPVHPRRFAPDVPEDFVDIIADMMEKEPGKRIARASQVAERLEPWTTEERALSSFAMVRSPWMAPPPPSHDDRLWDGNGFPEDSARDAQSVPQKPSSDEEVSHQEPSQTNPVSLEAGLSTESGMGGETYSDFYSHGQSEQYALTDPLSVSSGASHSQPLPIIQPAVQRIRGTTHSVGLTVALTIAIVLPPALLLGAIVGFILASR